MEIEHAVCFICLSEWLRDDKGKERAALVWKVFGRRKSHSVAALDNEPGHLHQAEGSGWTWGIDCFTEKQTFWGSLSKSKLKRTMSPQQIDRLMKRAVKRIQGQVWTWVVSNSNPPGRLLLLLERGGECGQMKESSADRWSTSQDSWEVAIHYFPYHWKASHSPLEGIHNCCNAEASLADLQLASWLQMLALQTAGGFLFRFALRIAQPKLNILSFYPWNENGDFTQTLMLCASDGTNSESV